MYILLTKLIISLISFIPAKSNFDDFLHFVSKNLYLSESVKRNCTWQYVIVKVEIDNNNIIKNYQIENEFDDKFLNSFKFLKGYKFENSKPLNRHLIVFFVSIENQRIDNCNIQKPLGKHEEPMKKFNLYKILQSKKGYNNLYINKIITQVIYEPIN